MGVSGFSLPPLLVLSSRLTKKHGPMEEVGQKLKSLSLVVPWCACCAGRLTQGRHFAVKALCLRWRCVTFTLQAHDDYGVKVMPLHRKEGEGGSCEKCHVFTTCCLPVCCGSSWELRICVQALSSLQICDSQKGFCKKVFPCNVAFCFIQVVKFAARKCKPSRIMGAASGRWRAMNFSMHSGGRGIVLENDAKEYGDELSCCFNGSLTIYILNRYDIYIN